MSKNLVDNARDPAEFLRLFPDFPKRYNNEFKWAYNAQSLPVIRRMAWIGAGIVLAFSVADFVIDNVNGPKAAAIRLVLSILIIATSWLPRRMFQQNLQSITSALVIAVGLGLLTV